MQRAGALLPHGSGRLQNPRSGDSAHNYAEDFSRQAPKGTSSGGRRHRPVKPGDKLDIGIAVGPYVKCPPVGYGGTEKVAADYERELRAMGHNVTKYASGDSEKRGKLVPITPEALWKPGADTRTVDTSHMYGKLLENSHNHDFVFMHTGPETFKLSKQINAPHAFMLHAPIYEGDEHKYTEHKDVPIISISDAQRGKLRNELNWIGTVHHGVPDTQRSSSPPTLSPDGKQEYAYLGRSSWKKGTDLAAQWIGSAGEGMRMGMVVQPWDKEFHEEHVAPHIDGEKIRNVGEIVGEKAKQKHLRGAKALVSPSQVVESFGLNTVEAFREGTPVIATRKGANAEIIEHGITGFLADTREEAREAFSKVGKLDRNKIRKVYEDKFTSRHMAENFLNVAHGEIGRWNKRRPAA